MNAIPCYCLHPTPPLDMRYGECVNCGGLIAPSTPPPQPLIPDKPVVTIRRRAPRPESGGDAP